MKIFKGFSATKQKTIPLYAEFFSELLPLIDDLAELKVLLFCFRALQQKEGAFRYLRRYDFAVDKALMQGLAVIRSDTENVLDEALERSVRRGALLEAQVLLGSKLETLYFFNTAKGRSAIQQIHKGKWQPSPDSLQVEILPDRPNVYQLYEQNIGLLTPLIADEIKDAENEFPSAWLEDAVKEAVTQNKRNWRYIRAILERWKTEGRHDEKSQGRTRQEQSDYTGGKYSDIIES